MAWKGLQMRTRVVVHIMRPPPTIGHRLGNLRARLGPTDQPASTNADCGGPAAKTRLDIAFSGSIHDFWMVPINMMGRERGRGWSAADGARWGGRPTPTPAARG